MAAGAIPAPGSKLGPCAKRCEHKDCARSRQDAETACIYCTKPIGYGAPFYNLATVGSVLRSGLAHAVCAEEKADA